ncbi:MAG: hypothetical protein M1830_008824 [Pleopsidium flavum]|nr:MAG: hypothetical protein M1830_008824 [Pleopsidium flavum]
MESYSRSSRNHLNDPLFVWDKKFSIRRQQAYQAEDIRLQTEPQQTIVDAFIEERISRLYPLQYSYTALRKYVTKARMSDLTAPATPAGHTKKLVLLDDRRDASGGAHSTRNWGGYAQYPPEGERKWSGVLDAGEFYRRMMEKRQDNGAERRTIYIADMTPLCTLAVVASASRLHAPVLRDYLQRHISYRVFFRVSMPFGFAMEFHLPYYALRKSPMLISDSRALHLLLVVGIDEWYWTVYCCVDRYFGSEETIQFYLDQHLDAPIGGAGRPTGFPVWNPREYFLLVLSRRIRQVTREWSNVVITLEERLESHEDSIFNERTLADTFVDDNRFTRTKEYSWTVQVLRLFHNSLVKLLESWESFQAGEVQYFRVKDNDDLDKLWRSYLASIEEDITELRFLRRSLQQRIEMFVNMRNGLVNASALVESRAATEQGKNIGSLTRVTVVYLPLSLATSIFSMAIMPREASWTAYVLLLILLFGSTILVVFNLGLMTTLWQSVRRRFYSYFSN